MNKLITYSIILIGFTFFSCENNLEVNPGIKPPPTPPAEISDTLVTYDYITDTDPGVDLSSGDFAFSSTHFDVSVKVDNGEYEDLDVIMSPAVSDYYDIIREGHSILWNEQSKKDDMFAQHNLQRTFSYVTVSFDDKKGCTLTFKVKSKDGFGAAKISPRSYNVSPDGSGDEITFTLTEANKYMSIDFMSDENIIKDVKHNQSTPNGYDWIKHMLCIFVDPLEKDVPKISGPGIVKFSEKTTDEEIGSAKLIYFAPGHYNLTNPKFNKGSNLSSNGALMLNADQKVYIAGGAFVEGLIYRKGVSNVGNSISVKGRGILSGRRYLWKTEVHNGLPIKNNSILGGSMSVLEGITILDSPCHGIVTGGNSDFDNVKMMGWHCNNDGFRPGGGTTIDNCFMRACDDFLYNYNLSVNNCVFWPMFNGSILTFGWQDIDLSGSELTDIDIINPEWVTMGNNKGLIMSQNSAGFKLMPGNGQTILRNITFEGSLPGFINLKPNSDYFTSIASKTPIASSEIGYIGDIVFENIVIDAILGEWIRPNAMLSGLRMNQITGVGHCAELSDRLDPTKNIIPEGENTRAIICTDNPNAKWMVKDLSFKNVTIGGKLLTVDLAKEYFYIDKNTTSNITFEGVEFYNR